MQRYRPLLTLLGVLGGLLVTLPARAAQLQYWRFDPRQNQLVFVTDSVVQPQAQFLFNPSRVVVDLPGTRLGRPTVNQAMSGTIRAIRVGQFDAQTTRLVIELSPDYIIDPKQIVVRGETPQQWAIELPPAQGRTLTNANRNRIQAVPATGARTEITGIRTTPDGFFIRTIGASPKLTVERLNDTQIVLQLEDATIASSLAGQTLPSNRFGVTAWSIEQDETKVPTLQISLTVLGNSADWQASVSSGRNIVILPPRDVVIAAESPGPESEIEPDTEDTLPIAVQPLPKAESPISPSPFPPSPPPTIPPTDITTPLSNITVVLDPGHGGRDPGAVGIGGLREKDVVSAIAYDTAAILEKRGVRTILTRTEDLEIDLDPRVQIAQRADADLFVSIHANSISLSRPEVNGLETYYYSSGLQLAKVIHSNVLQQLNVKDRGVRQARFYVLRNTSMPAVLVETGFVTGAQDARNFNDPGWRKQMAEAIAQGIIQYIQQELLHSDSQMIQPNFA